MKLAKNDERPMTDMGNGVGRRTMVWGDRMLMAEIHLEPGGQVPRHDHEYEQIGYCFSGRFDLTVGDETQTIEPGMGWVIPGGVPHSATGLDTSFLIEIWNPARDDYKD